MKGQPQCKPILTALQLVKVERLLVGGEERFDVQSFDARDVGDIGHVANPRLFFQPIGKPSSVKRKDRPPRRTLAGMLCGNSLEHLIAEQSRNRWEIVA